MTDEALRRAQRDGAASEELLARLRAGELPEARVRAAALFGYSPALALAPRRQPLEVPPGLPQSRDGLEGDERYEWSDRVLRWEEEDAFAATGLSALESLSAGLDLDGKLRTSVGLGLHLLERTPQELSGHDLRGLVEQALAFLEAPTWELESALSEELVEVSCEGRCQGSEHSQAEVVLGTLAAFLHKEMAESNRMFGKAHARVLRNRWSFEPLTDLLNAWRLTGGTLEERRLAFEELLDASAETIGSLLVQPCGQPVQDYLRAMAEADSRYSRAQAQLALVRERAPGTERYLEELLAALERWFDPDLVAVLARALPDPSVLVPFFEAQLRGESSSEAFTAARLAPDLGRHAEPLLPSLRALAAAADPVLVRFLQNSIAEIEASLEAEPSSE